MRHLTCVTRQQDRPTHAASLLVKDAQLGVLSTFVSVISAVLGMGINGALSGVAWGQEISDLLTKADTHGN